MKSKKKPQTRFTAGHTIPARSTVRVQTSLDAIKQAERHIAALIRSQASTKEPIEPGMALFLIALRASEITGISSFTEPQMRLLVAATLGFLEEGKWTLDPSFPYTKEQMIADCTD